VVHKVHSSRAALTGFNIGPKTSEDYR